ncbi:RHS repeat domain-containing protein, partial [Enterobacter asburiae]
MARSTTTFSYQDSDAAARDFGRLKSALKTVHNDLHPDAPYETETVMAFTYDSTTHHQTRTVTVSALKNAADSDFSAPVLITSRETSGLSGRLISQTDAAGNTVSYGYDELGRPKETTLHPENHLYRQTAHIDYLPKDAQNRQQIIHTDPMNRRQRTTFDALGNVLTR